MINILVTSADCANSALATSLTVVKKFLTILQIVGPILLILSLTISFLRNNINPDDKKSIKRIINSIIAMIIMFFIPVLINSIMLTLGQNFTVSECWNSIDGTSNDRNPSYQDPYENRDRVNIYDDTKEYDKSNEKEENNNTENTTNDDSSNDSDKGKTVVDEPKL